jgi:hypothetical protein
MGEPDLLRYLNGLGLSLRVDGGSIIVTPAVKLTDGARELIRSRRQELVEQVKAVSLTTAALIAAIHAACDARGDDDANRRALVEEGSALSPEAQADVTQHFCEVTRLWRRANRGLSPTATKDTR